ncbi:MAG TPA: histidine kinase [Rectinemataceae bacterium]|nr:histidine kinase [Rectinemataceae bacterium]
MARYRTVRRSIFLWVSILLVCLLLAFSLIAYDYASTMARERFADALTSLSNSVMANLDGQVAEMDRLSLTLIYSQVFRSLYSKHMDLPRFPETVRQRIEKLENSEQLIEIGDTILGPNQSAPQVNVFDPRGEMIGAGYYSRLTERDAKLESWYPEVLRKNGDRVLLPPHMDPLQEETSVVVKGKLYVSLLRSFQDPMLSTRGIVEVMQYCDVLFAELDLLAGSSASIFVLDADGRSLYPYEGSPLGKADLLLLATRSGRGPLSTAVLPGRREPEIYATAVSRETGWTLILGEPSAGLSSSIVQYATRIALLTLSAILCSLAASYFISRRVTVPIKALHSEIEALELHNLEEVAEAFPSSNLSEIDSLRLAFRDMRLKLNESVQEAISLRAHEKEAQLVALQSQLNPHFLYNMLQTIAIMADEGLVQPIQTLILNLSKMLRYISSSEGTTATIGTELEFAERYLAAMRARFGDSLVYVVDVCDAMRELAVPRLIIQPFMENCFKYATAARPPWRIEIRGTVAQAGWTVEILDNGPGFSEETLAHIEGRLAARRTRGEGLASLSISGMGLLNSFERLRLAFGERAFFEIGNLPAGGARIAMGVRPCPGGVGPDGRGAVTNG